MFTGKHGDYYWIEWRDTAKSLSNLLADFPALVLGKHLVNTSSDSGSLWLSPEEVKQGWHKKDRLTYSPVIKSVESIPSYGYEEWYVFDSPIEFKNYEIFINTFINYGGFSLENNLFKKIQVTFWQQLERLKPESFIAEGGYLILVTEKLNLYSRILKTVETD